MANRLDGDATLGMAVGRYDHMSPGCGPGHIVLDGDQRSLKGARPSPSFGPYMLSSNSWIDQGATN